MSKRILVADKLPPLSEVVVAELEGGSLELLVREDYKDDYWEWARVRNPYYDRDFNKWLAWDSEIDLEYSVTAWYHLPKPGGDGDDTKLKQVMKTNGLLDESVSALKQAIAEQDKTWLALLQECAKLSDAMGLDDGDWVEAGDETLMEQFDPWVVIRQATEALTAIKGVRIDE
jgi:hypothetical protein